MLGGLSRTWWKWKLCSDVESNVMALNNMFGSNISSNSSGNSNKSSSNSSSNSNGRTAVVAATAALCSVFRTHSKIIQDISSHEKYYFIITIIESLAFDVTKLLNCLHLLQEFVAISPFRAMPWFGNLKEAASTAATTVATAATETAAVAAT